MRRLLFCLLCTVFVIAACGDDDDAGDTTTTTAPTEASVSGDDDTGDEGEDPGADDPVVRDDDEAEAGDDGDGLTPEDALAFFAATETTCADWSAETGNPVVEPERFADATVTSELADGLFAIEDGRGTPLQVDVMAGLVFGDNGPEGVMPRPYAFGCPAELYVGTLDE